MSGAGIKVDLSAYERAEKRLERLSDMDRGKLLDAVGSVVESQTRNRIENDEESPDGEPWDLWSPRYESTRHGGHSLLQNEGDLIGSIGFEVLDDSSVEIGTNLIYGATHQFGDESRGIPERPFLGLSDDDESEIDAVIDNFIDRLME